MRTCTRRLEFDAAHRVTRHESKCRNLHGHRYAVEVTCGTYGLDEVGRVIDFGVVKAVFGTWVDNTLDHGVILYDGHDEALLALCVSSGWRVYLLNAEPTAEVLADHLATIATGLLAPLGVYVVHLRIYETPSCWADWHAVEGEGPF